MTFIGAYNKAFADILMYGYNTETYENFEQDEFFGTVIFRKRATLKDKPRMIVKVYSDNKVNKNGKCVRLTGEEVTEFLEKYM